MGFRQVRVERNRLLEQWNRRVDVALPKSRPGHVDRPVWVSRINRHHRSEGRLGAAQVSLQQQADAVVVPPFAHPWVQRSCDRGERCVRIDDQQGGLCLGHHGRRDIGDRLDLPGDVGRVAREEPLSVVIRFRDRWRRLRRVALAGVGPLGEPPGKLAIVDLRAQGDAIAGVLRDLQPVVDGVGRARRNQAHIRHRAGHPGVPFIDRVAVLVELQAAVEVRARVHRTAAPVLSHPAVEQDTPLFVHRLEFHPHVEAVDGPAWKEVPDVACADDHLYPDRLSASHGDRYLVEWGDHVRWCGASG